MDLDTPHHIAQVNANTMSDQNFAHQVFDNLTSYLGPYNPFAHDADLPTDEIWILDNTASLVTDVSSGSETWTASILAAYFTRRSGKDLTKAVAQISKTIGLAQDDAAVKIIEKRLRPFFDQILPSRTCEIMFGGEGNSDGAVQVRNASGQRGSSDWVQTLGPSDRSGISTNEIHFIENHKDGERVSSKVLPPVFCVSAHTTFALPTGWAVISDIDDTIKKTLTNSAVGILKTTFAEEAEPIAGMPEFYRHMRQTLNDPPFWYLSASPYNLYPFLHAFRDKYYPSGTTLLRDASWMDIAGFLTSMTKGTQEYKVDAMKKIHKTFSKRSFVCLGDSTQSDPEAYAEMYRNNAGWIKAIFIRKVLNVVEVTDVLEKNAEAKRNAPERFEKAFEGVPKHIWTVFEDSTELYGALDAAVKR